MKFKIAPNTIQWWYWAVTLVAMIVGLAGWREGFWLVMFVSAIQVGHFWASKGFAAFPTQVRTVYFVLTVIAFFDPTTMFFAALLVGTIMVTFFDRCIIARVLVRMPWNKGIQLS